MWSKTHSYEHAVLSQIFDNVFGEPSKAGVQPFTGEGVRGLEVDRVSRDPVQSQLGFNLFERKKKETI